MYKLWQTPVAHLCTSYRRQDVQAVADCLADPRSKHVAVPLHSSSSTSTPSHVISVSAGARMSEEARQWRTRAAPHNPCQPSPLCDRSATTRAWRPPTNPPPPRPSPTSSSGRRTSSGWILQTPPHLPPLTAASGPPTSWHPACPAAVTCLPFRRTTSWSARLPPPRLQ